MPAVVGVKLRFAQKRLLFDPAGATPAVGEFVVIKTDRGTELAAVAVESHELPAEELSAPLEPIVRVATPQDMALAKEHAELERAALVAFRELAREHKLDIKPVEAEYLFGGERLVIYFTSEERIDFRALVRELASRLRARIEMRQVGVRDEARIIGGHGHCGEHLCCARLGGDFQPVSIRMAKEQDLPLNPLKISGLCGRLMCCLRYEYDAYKEFKSRAPRRGTPVATPIGAGKVADLDTVRERVRVQLDGGGSIAVPLSAMKCERGCPCTVDQEALESVSDAHGGLLARLAAGQLEAPGASRAGAAPQERVTREAGNVPAQARRTGARRGSRVHQVAGESAQVPATETAETSAGRARRRRRRRRPPSAGGSSGESGS